MKTAIALFALLVAMPAARAGEIKSLTVQGLMENCRSQHPEERIFCMGWIGGASATIFDLGKAKVGVTAACLTSPVTYAALEQVFLNWADKNPKLWSAGALMGIYMALHETWPCPEQ